MVFKNARFPALAEILTTQLCQGVAEKVSVVSFTCSVSEGSDYRRGTPQANGTRPRIAEVLICIPGERFRAERHENQDNRWLGDL